VAAKCLDHGLIVRALPGGDSLAFSPPLIITEQEIDACVDRFGKALAEVQDELTREGVHLAA